MPQPSLQPRRCPALIALACALIVAGGCTGREADRADLVLINGAEPETIDPALVSAQVGMRITDGLFEGLVRLDIDGRPELGAAERYEVSEDGKTYTFHLRPEAHWSDGTPLRASDFAESWLRVLDPKTGADYAAMLYVIRGARDFNGGLTEDPEGVGVRATGPRTLVVELENPTPYFIDLCAFVTFSPLHPDNRAAGEEAWADRPGSLVSNGAFTLSDWRLNDRIRLEKNPQYWDRDSVELETIDVLPIEEPNTAINFFLTGAADLIMDKGMVPGGMSDALREQPYFHSGSFLGTYFTRFNVTRPPFDDPRVRRAFSMAIDRARITEKITRMGEPVAFSLTPPGTGVDYLPPPSTCGFDPAGAAALMAEAGYPGGRGFPAPDYLYMAKAVETHIAVELQDMWKEHLGVTVTLTKQEPRAYYASMRGLDYDLCRSSWVGDYNDPSTFLEMFVSGSGNNRTGFAHGPYDALIARAAAEPDPVARYEIFGEAEKLLISEQCVVLPIYHYVGVQFYRPEEVGGIRPNLVDHHPLRLVFRK